MHSPVNSYSQESVGGDVEGHGPQVVDGGAEDVAVLPGQLLHHVVIHLEGAAHDGHDEVRDGQVGDQQVGEVPQLLVAGQAGDEDEVADATDQHDAGQGHPDHDLGCEEGAGFGQVVLAVQRQVVVAVGEIERERGVSQGGEIPIVGVVDCSKAEAGGGV